MPNPVTEAFGASTWLTVALGVVLFFWYTRDYWELVMRTLGRDLTGLSVLIRVKLLLRKYKKQDASVASLFRKNVKKHPLKPLFLYEDQVWTFQDIEDFSNRVGNYFLTLGFTAGDEVTLFMENRPEYVGIWLGLSKIGVIPALVNSGLRSSALAASVGVVEGTRALIYGTELDQAVKEALPLMEAKGLQLEYFAYGSEKSQITRAQDLGAVLKGISAREPEYEAGFLDKLLYIYTSGTTGLPKAAIIRQSRYIMLAQPNCMPGIVGQDHVIYVSMPLYHSLGGGVGVGLALIHGHTLVIKRKFSPRTFWDDCIKTKCTMFIYVGEVCRYLLAQPKMAKDRQHQVRTMLGVGFRSNIWSDFVQRFGVASVLEFYGSTEGNFQIVNLNSAAGSCGFIPQIIPEAIRNFLFPAVLVKVDQETGEPLRTRAGLCVRCKAGEIGQFVVKIVTGDPLRNFDGYVDRTAT
ncbi:Long-chain fatty acid transport protein 4 [Halotydeus destructor]|nr:Long-chain fatty acid transport protein 4 [Halotydeus destructor]